MSYELTTKEAYKGYPTAREKTNFVQVNEFDQLDELTNEVVKSIMSIHHKFEILREWEEFTDDHVTKKSCSRDLGNQRDSFGHLQFERKQTISPNGMIV